MPSPVSSTRVRIVLSLLVVTQAGFYFKLYSGPAQHWFNNYGAGVLYEVLWCLVLFFFFSRREMITKIAVGVFAATCFLCYPFHIVGSAIIVVLARNQQIGNFHFYITISQ